jgi:hypothetical protein
MFDQKQKLFTFTVAINDSWEKGVKVIMWSGNVMIDLLLLTVKVNAFR